MSFTKRFFVPKNVLCNLLFQLFEMVFCELVLLELGDLLGLSLLRNFFSAASLTLSPTGLVIRLRKNSER